MIKHILTDIEGTTSSIRFVHEVLFPYARAEIGRFVREHAQQPEVQAQLIAVQHEAAGSLDIDQSVALLEQWIDEDRKITPLKSLQGMIWEAGYRQGDFTGHVYEDAVRNLRHWHEMGLGLYVYSSGSVHAQRLLFGYSDYGDLTPLFSGYFDTHIGNKRETSSYEAIVGQIGGRAGEILFLSDIREELDAARAAGMQTRWLVREAEQLDRNAPHHQVKDFDSINLD
ncbi:MAG: acireductone synthase [Chromatiales bacterium]|nr:acireductone synthase [Gammaproteobacteria bacterium]MBW6475619.1 acireductone synthase [Chromatiales bacterium]